MKRHRPRNTEGGEGVEDRHGRRGPTRSEPEPSPQRPTYGVHRITSPEFTRYVSEIEVVVLPPRRS